MATSVHMNHEFIGPFGFEQPLWQCLYSKQWQHQIDDNFKNFNLPVLNDFCFNESERELQQKRQDGCNNLRFNFVSYFIRFQIHVIGLIDVREEREREHSSNVSQRSECVCVLHYCAVQLLLILNTLQEFSNLNQKFTELQ